MYDTFLDFLIECELPKQEKKKGNDYLVKTFRDAQKLKHRRIQLKRNQGIKRSMMDLIPEPDPEILSQKISNRLNINQIGDSQVASQVELSDVGVVEQKKNPITDVFSQGLTKITSIEKSTPFPCPAPSNLDVSISEFHLGEEGSSKRAPSNTLQSPQTPFLKDLRLRRSDNGHQEDSKLFSPLKKTVRSIGPINRTILNMENLEETIEQNEKLELLNSSLEYPMELILTDQSPNYFKREEDEVYFEEELRDMSTCVQFKLDYLVKTFEKTCNEAVKQIEEAVKARDLILGEFLSDSE